VAWKKILLEGDVAPGLLTKSGQVTTGPTGKASVTFATPFPNTNYAIIANARVAADTVFVQWDNKTPTGFDLYAYDDGGKAEANVVIDWMAVEYSNP